MTGEEYARKKKLVGGYEALERNCAYQEELLPLFERHYRDALAGLRDRTVPRERRDEYLEAAEQAERLMGFVGGRLDVLRKELEAAVEGGGDLEEDDGVRSER